MLKRGVTQLQIDVLPAKISALEDGQDEPNGVIRDTVYFTRTGAPTERCEGAGARPAKCLNAGGTSGIS